MTDPWMRAEDDLIGQFNDGLIDEAAASVDLDLHSGVHTCTPEGCRHCKRQEDEA